MTETQWEHDMMHHGDNADPCTGEPIELTEPRYDGEGDQWADVPEDYRAEVCDEVPQVGTYGITEHNDLDRQAAEKLLKRYHRLSIEEREAVQFVDDEIARAEETLEALRARRAELLKPIERKRQWLDQFKCLLESWARQALEGKRERSIKLTYGAVKFRKNPDRLDVTDEAAAMYWFDTNEIRGMVRRSLDKTAVKRYIKETGECPEGVEWATGEDTFAVEVE